MFSVRVTEESKKREFAEWFKAASLSLAKGINFHMFESYTLWKKKINLIKFRIIMY
jgi:hypothetical protein